MTVQRKLKENAERIDQMIAGNTGEPAPKGKNDDQPPTLPTETGGQEGFKPVEKPSGDEATWESRYSVLMGKYNAEVPRLQQEVRDLNAKLSDQAPNTEVAELRSQLAKLTSELDQAKQQQQPAPVSNEQLSEKEAQLRADYGDELFDFFSERDRATKNQIDTIGKELGNTNQELAIADRKTVLRQRLSPMGIDFDQRNNDQGFIDFLGSHAENGITLQEKLGNAFAGNDIETVVRIFQSYGQPQQESAQANLSGQVQVQPTASGFDDPNAGTADVWTPAQIQAFYADKSAGRLSPEDAARYEKSLGAFLARNG